MTEILNDYSTKTGYGYATVYAHAVGFCNGI